MTDDSPLPSFLPPGVPAFVEGTPGDAVDGVVASLAMAAALRGGPSALTDEQVAALLGRAGLPGDAHHVAQVRARAGADLLVAPPRP